MNDIFLSSINKVIRFYELLEWYKAFKVNVFFLCLHKNPWYMTKPYVDRESKFYSMLLWLIPYII